jgi:hypothetical protein
MQEEREKHAAMHLERHAIALPAPTAWPLGLAFGITLLLGSLVTNWFIGLLGIVVTVASCIGWFREVLPHEHHEEVQVATEHIPILTARPEVAKVRGDETHRASLPLRTYPFVSGLKGGFAGGTVMIVLAEIYSLVVYHSLWYVVNLLGGAGVAVWAHPTEHQLMSFHPLAFGIAVVIHTVASFLVGLLYGALLPIMPKHPIILGGLLAPAAWTGLLHFSLGIVNPYFDTHINWWWFAVCQVGFGLTAGYVVSRLGSYTRLQHAPLSVRLGVETPEHMQGHGPEGGGL